MMSLKRRSKLWLLPCIALAILCSFGIGQAVSDDDAPPAVRAKVQVLRVPALKFQPAQVQAVPSIRVKAVPAVRLVPAIRAQKVEVQELVIEPAQEGAADESAITPNDMEEYEQQYMAEQSAMMKQLRADPAWRPSHEPSGLIKVGTGESSGSLHNFCLNIDGTILACCGGKRFEYVQSDDPMGMEVKEIDEPSSIKVYSTEGALMRTWQLDAKPQAICVHTDGSIFVGGDGRIVKLSRLGRVVTAVDSPAIATPKPTEEAEEEEKPVARTESKSILGALVQALSGGADGPAMSEEQLQAMEEAQNQRKKDVTGIAVTDQDVFVACPAPEGYGYAVYRLDHKLENAKLIVDNLSGCCGQMDIQANNGELWVAYNGRHRVVRYDRDGKELSQFGKAGRKNPDEFGGCCEPKNLRFDDSGDVYCAESGPPNVVKKFSPEGEFRGVVVLDHYEGGCVRTTVEVTANGNDVFVLNTATDTIHRYTSRAMMPSHEQVSTIAISGDGAESVVLHTLCMDADGNLLAAAGGEKSTVVRGPNGVTSKVIKVPNAIRVLSPEGEQIAAYELETTPEKINVAEDGTIFVAGEGRLVKLDKQGAVLLTADAPHIAKLPPLPDLDQIPEEEELDEAAKEAKQAKIKELREKMNKAMPGLLAASKELRESRGDKDAQLAATEKYNEVYQEYREVSQQLTSLITTPRVLAMRQRATAMRKRVVTGIAATGEDVFISCPAVEGYGFDVWRTDRNFTNAEKIVTGLRGCCGNMDIQAHDGELYVAENARGRVVRYDRDGKVLATFGAMDRKGGIEGFGSCCNPMNVRIDSEGIVYTSESNVGRIKRFSREGEFLGVVGTVKIIPGCKHVPITISQDGSRVYMLDITRSHIVVMAQRGAEMVAKTAATNDTTETKETAVK